jgi:hypothetical protein
MLDSSMLVLTEDGYRQVADLARKPGVAHSTISRPTIRRRPYRGKVVYLYTEQGDDPFVCTPDHRLLVKTHDGHVRWLRAADVTRGSYIGTVIPDIFEGYGSSIARDKRRLLENQLGSITSGVCRAVRDTGMDDESSQSDTFLDESFCWYKVHDLESSTEPGTFMYHTSTCIANNICCVDFV